VIWTLRGYGPEAVFVSETVNGQYAECWPGDALRPLWGHSQTFIGYELYPYYAYVGRYGTLIRKERGSPPLAFGSLEECMDVVEAVMSSGGRELGERTYRERDRRFAP